MSWVLCFLLHALCEDLVVFHFNFCFLLLFFNLLGNFEVLILMLVEVVFNFIYLKNEYLLFFVLSWKFLCDFHFVVINGGNEGYVLFLLSIMVFGLLHLLFQNMQDLTGFIRGCCFLGLESRVLKGN